MNHYKLKIDEQVANAFGMLIGLCSLIFLLLYNWRHTGGLLAKHVTPASYGYLCAVGIELGVVWLSFKMGKLRKSNRNMWHTFFPYSLMMVVIVSMAANLSEGFLTRYGLVMEISNLKLVDPIQFFISILATLMISIIVFALSDVVSSDSKALVQIDKVKNSDKHTDNSESKVIAKPIEVTPEQKFITYITQYPYATYRELERNVSGVGKISEIKQRTRDWGWYKNGNGWERISEN